MLHNYYHHVHSWNMCYVIVVLAVVLFYKSLTVGFTLLSFNSYYLGTFVMLHNYYHHVHSWNMCYVIVVQALHEEVNIKENLYTDSIDYRRLRVVVVYVAISDSRWGMVHF